MVLNNLIYNQQSGPVNISITGTSIVKISTDPIPTEKDTFQLEFSNALAFPGLINSHDHLDFNCFQPLSNIIYNNYTEWGNYIHSEYKDEINDVLKIPITLRTEWGLYKNLLAGVTTVVNHGQQLAIPDPLITVLQDAQSLHSVQFDPLWKWKLNNPFKKNRPCVIHTGEGTDASSAEEIDQLLKWNLLKRELIAIHGVAMNESQAKKFKALVWCPASNQYLLGTTAAVKELSSSTDIIFGTDSTLTGTWNIWEQLRLARNMQLISDQALYDMVSQTPARVWGLNGGQIAENRDADMLIVKNKEHQSWFDLFFDTNPEDILLLLHKGIPVLFDASVFTTLNDPGFNKEDYYPIELNEHVKYVRGNLPATIATIRSYYAAVQFPI